MTRSKQSKRKNTDKLNLSKRLSVVAQWIIPGNTVSDIGTDHGYLPIYLIKKGISAKVIAMDVRKGPLEKAAGNCEFFKVESGIELRLSDGLEALKPDEADTITICGMGGKLMKRILEDGCEKYSSSTQLIFSPQSDIREFRIYLYNNGFSVVRETFLVDERKHYLIMECRCDGEKKENPYDEDTKEPDFVKEIDFRFGKKLLDEKNPYLLEFIRKERVKSQKVLELIKQIKEPDMAVQDRLKQVEFDLKCFDYAIGGVYGEEVIRYC